MDKLFIRQVSLPHKNMSTDLLLDYYNDYKTLHELFGDTYYQVTYKRALDLLQARHTYNR